MKYAIFAIFLLSITPFAICGKNRDIQVVFQWNLLNYGFPSASDRQEAEANGNLVPENGTPIEVTPHYQSNGMARIFTTVPRFTTGIPYSLATVTEGSQPQLQPYPNYQSHSSHGSDCDGITSAFRVAINECNQMWVIDSGVIGSAQHCPPQLLLFDLATDQLIHRFRFNSTLFVPRASLFITPVVNVRDPPPRGQCKRQMVYVADVSYHGLVVYDYQQNSAWRAENKFMYPDPDYGTHFIAGENFTLMDGILGMATDKRNLYFHPMASISEFAVPLSVLDNRATWDENTEAMTTAFQRLGTRSSECAATAMDSRDNLYCVTFNPIKLIRWNVNTPYRGGNLREVPANPRLLEFVSGMHVVRNSNGKEELWMLSNRFQKIAAGTQIPNDTNFRILRRHLDDIQSQPNRIESSNDLHNKLIFN